MASPSKAKRIGRTSQAQQLRSQLFGDERSRHLTTHLWPDSYRHLAADAAARGISPSGMNHLIIREHYQLPPIP